MKRPVMVILAGGRGSRLGSLTDNCQKCMVDIDGKPFLARLIDNYRGQGFETFIILTGYKAEQVEAYGFGQGVSFFRDPWKWGTDIAVSSATSQLGLTSYWVVNGDTWIWGTLPNPDVSTITIACNMSAGAYYQADCSNMPRLHLVQSFTDIGTPNGLKWFRECWTLTQAP